MAQIPTVMIRHPHDPNDYTIINEADFDPKKHVRFGEKIPAAEPVALGTDSGDQFSDAQLRSAIEAATGKKPHPNTKRETLIAKFNELNAE